VIHCDIINNKGDEIMAVSKDNERILVTVTKETADKIKELADQDKRSKSSMASILIDRGLEGYYK
jgi:hypothetical protein